MNNKDIMIYDKAGKAGEKDTNPTHHITAAYWDERAYQRPIPVQSADWRIYAVRYVALAVFIILGLIIFWIWRTIHCWGGANYLECLSWDYWTPRIVFGALLAPFVLWLVQWVLKIKNDALGHKGEARRMQFERDRFGNLVPMKLYEEIDNQTLLAMYLGQYSASTQLKAETAQWEQFNGVNTLNYSPPANVSSVVNVDKPDEIEEGAILPDTTPVDEWLPKLTDQYVPHLLLVGKTRSGKSTLADIVLKDRADRGDRIAILDPHWQTVDAHGNPKWGGIPPIAMSMDEIPDVLHQLRLEYEDRLRRMRLPKDDPDRCSEMMFDPITILIDEVPEVVSALKRMGSSVWDDTVTIFGSGGAKVNINVILLSQSPNVDDVGMNAKMRENFCILALPTLTQAFIKKEAPPGDKAALLQILADNSKPGAKPYELPIAGILDGKMQILLRDGIYRQRATKIYADAWQLSESSVWAENTESAPKRTFPTDQTQTDRRTAMLKELVTANVSRENARRILSAAGFGFDNNLWTEIRREMSDDQV